jgi:alanine racemase
MYRKTYVKIDSCILQDNVKQLIKKYNSYKYYIGIVKANAYGHGDYIVNNIIKSGINYLAVSSLEEAISIRKYNQDIPILVLEPISLEYIDIIQKNNITITIDSLEYTISLSKIQLPKQLKVHIKLDTGMNRIGFKIKDEVNESIKYLKSNNSIYLEGIYTHIGTSGISDNYYNKSIDKFEYLTSDIKLKEIPIIHINRSITVSNHEIKPYETGVRLGIIMYGFNQNENNNLNLHTAFELYSEVISIRKVEKGEYVGYNANYIAKEDILVATIPIGYNDGMKQEMQSVSINNKQYEFVGDICMDMIMVKVDDTVKLHDKVEIFGNNISIIDTSNKINSNPYRLLTSISTRVPRIYDDNTEIKY